MQLKNYRDYNNTKRKEFGCLMAYLDFPEINILQNQISDYDIREDFRDNGEPHITILYGFHLDETNYEDIAEECKHLIKEPIIDIRIVDVSIFENKDFDVLKLAIESETLSELNEYFKRIFPHTNDFPDYNPHITIEYLKPGKGTKYVNSIDLQEIREVELICDKIVYSMGSSYYKPFTYIPSEREIL